ncbi:UNVERIFIED_CONTAM: hypothetical protein GTU68_065020 [Idotea baltica]|nr:hypothetical protein [Idotea baltica]
MWLFLILVLVPIIEIALFIQVGGFLGLWPTLAIVILTAFAGTALLRSQGFAVMGQLQNSMAQGESPVTPIINGALILVAGVVLLTPGFFTDTVGILLLIPPIRAAIIKWGGAKLVNSANVHVYSNQPEQAPKNTPNDTVEGDFSVIDEDKDPGNSGWTKH